MTANCKQCNAEFEQKVDWQRFCSGPCREKFWSKAAKRGRKVIDEEAAAETLPATREERKGDTNA